MKFLWLLILTSIAAATPVQPRLQVAAYTPPEAIIHRSKFTSLDCAVSKDPEAINSPDPLVIQSPIEVSFIVGSDGIPAAAFILQGSDAQADNTLVLNLVKRWRYHPSSCNGVPSVSEVEVVFLP